MNKISRSFLIGGAEPDDEQTETVSPNVLPMVSDDDIDRIYNKMIDIDPNYRSFTGDKREYVYEMFVQMETFITFQSTFMEKVQPMSGGGPGDEPVKLPKIATSEAKPDEGPVVKELDKEEDDVSKAIKETVFKKEIEIKEVIIRSETKPGDEAESKVIKTTVMDFVKVNTASLTGDDLIKTVESFRSLHDSIKNEVVNQQKAGIDIADYLSKNAEQIIQKVMNITLYPYIGDFTVLNGRGTEQRRLFYRFSEDASYLRLEQGKLGEFILKSNPGIMTDYGFTNELFTLGSFLFDIDNYLDQDIFDLQRLTAAGLRLAEVKTYFDDVAKPKFQQTKAIIAALALKSLTDDNVLIGGVKFDKDQLKKHGIPLFFNVFDRRLKNNTVATGEALPLSVQYDMLALIESLGKVNMIMMNADGSVNHTSLLDALQSVNASEIFKFKNNRLTSRKKQADKYKIFSQFDVIVKHIKSVYSKEKWYPKCKSDDTTLVGGIKTDYGKKLTDAVDTHIQTLSNDEERGKYVAGYVCINAGGIIISGSEVSFKVDGEPAKTSFRASRINSGSTIMPRDDAYTNISKAIRDGKSFNTILVDNFKAETTSTTKDYKIPQEGFKIYRRTSQKPIVRKEKSKALKAQRAERFERYDNMVKNFLKGIVDGTDTPTFVQDYEPEYDVQYILTELLGERNATRYDPKPKSFKSAFTDIIRDYGVDDLFDLVKDSYENLKDESGIIKAVGDRLKKIFYDELNLLLSTGTENDIRSNVDYLYKFTKGRKAVPPPTAPPTNKAPSKNGRKLSVKT